MGSIKTNLIGLENGFTWSKILNQLFKLDLMLPFIFGETGLLDHIGGGANYFTTIFALINSKQVYLLDKFGLKAVIAGPRGS